MNAQRTRFGISTIFCRFYVKAQKSHSTKDFFDREDQKTPKTAQKLKLFWKVQY